MKKSLLGSYLLLLLFAGVQGLAFGGTKTDAVTAVPPASKPASDATGVLTKGATHLFFNATAEEVIEEEKEEEEDKDNHEAGSLKKSSKNHTAASGVLYAQLFDPFQFYVFPSNGSVRGITSTQSPDSLYLLLEVIRI